MFLRKLIYICLYYQIDEFSCQVHIIFLLSILEKGWFCAIWAKLKAFDFGNCFMSILFDEFSDLLFNLENFSSFNLKIFLRNRLAALLRYLSDHPTRRKWIDFCWYYTNMYLSIIIKYLRDHSRWTRWTSVFVDPVENSRLWGAKCIRKRLVRGPNVVVHT